LTARWHNPLANVVRRGAPVVQKAHRAWLVLAIVLGHVSLAALAVWRGWPDPPVWLAWFAATWRVLAMGGFFLAFGVSSLQATVRETRGAGSEATSSLRIAPDEVVRPSLAFWGMGLNILPLVVYVGVLLWAGR
jgi:hypothetical protein